MPKRCILLFPNFENMDVIHAIRDKYDPLSNVIKPHITLVFPFESDITTNELETHIRTSISNTAPFNLAMQGITVSVEPRNNYIFLNVTTGLQEIYELSQKLYTGILEQYQSKLYKKAYCPHLTIGRLNKTEDYEGILNNIGNQKTEFSSYIDCISVEIIIGEDESSALETTIRL